MDTGDTILDDGENSGLDANLEAVSTVLGEYASQEGATFSISRQTGKGNEPMEFIMKCEASDYPDLDTLRTHLGNTYGGGKYRLYVKIDKKTVKNILIPVAQPIAVPDTKNSDVAEILKFMAEQNRDMLQQVINAQRAQANPIDQAIALTAAMSSMTKNLIGTTQGRDNGDPMDMFDKMLSFADRLNGMRGNDSDDEEKTPWYADAMKAAIPIFAAAIPEIAGAKRPAVLPPPIVPGDAPAIPPAVPTAKMELNAMNLNTLPAAAIVQYATPQIPKLAGFLSLIQNGAVIESDPQAYATLVLDGLPATVEDEQIRALLTRPDALDILGTLFPPSLAYKKWYGELFKAMLADVTEESDDTGEPKGDND